jgi:hypothetical protein
MAWGLGDQGTWVLSKDQHESGAATREVLTSVDTTATPAWLGAVSYTSGVFADRNRSPLLLAESDVFRSRAAVGQYWAEVRGTDWRCGLCSRKRGVEMSRCRREINREFESRFAK